MSTSSSEASDGDVAFHADAPTERGPVVGWGFDDAEFVFSDTTPAAAAKKVADDGGEWPTFDEPRSLATKAAVATSAAAAAPLLSLSTTKSAQKKAKKSGLKARFAAFGQDYDAIVAVAEDEADTDTDSDSESDDIDSDEAPVVVVVETPPATPSAAAPPPPPPPFEGDEGSNSSSDNDEDYDTGEGAETPMSDAERRKQIEQKEADAAAQVAADKKARLAKAERVLAQHKADAEREKAEAEQAARNEQQKRLERDAAQRDANQADADAKREQDEAIDAAQRAAAEKEALARKQKAGECGDGDVVPPREVEPVPRESIPEMAERVEKTSESTSSPSPSQQQQAEVAAVVALHSKDPNQLATARHDSAAMQKLHAALKALHAYAATPAERRAARFDNGVFVALSKKITSAHVERLARAVATLAKALPAGERTLYQGVPPPDLAVGPLLQKISVSLAALVASQCDAPSAQRRALAQALVAAVVDSFDEAERARNIHALAFTLLQMLLSEAASLKTAALVAENAAKKAQFKALSAAIVRDVSSFVNKADAALPTSASAKKVVAQIADVSRKFPAIALRYAPIACHGCDGGDATGSHATEFAMLMRELVLRHPAVADFSEPDSYAATLTIHAMFLLPELVVYPQATYDILAGMLDGFAATFGSVEREAERAQVLANWKTMSDAIKAEVVVLQSAARSGGGDGGGIASVASSDAPKKLSVGTAKKAAEFISRFAYDSDDD